MKIWCVGSSLIKHAFVVARHQPSGLNLGLKNADIWWQGYSGLSLLDLMSKLKSLKFVGDMPDIILLHCGGNDLGRLSLVRIRSLLDDIINFINLNFRCKIVWSQLLPRAAWRYSDNHGAMDSNRKRVNSYAAKRIIMGGGFYIRHPDLGKVTPSLYNEDGIHLSFHGNCLFLERLSLGLRTCIDGDTSCY